MKYLGGKARIAAWVREAVLSRTARRARYVEPFVGSCAVLCELGPHFAESDASDASPDLVAYLRAVAEEGWLPPEVLTRAEYRALRAEGEPSAMRGHAAFNCSFGGMAFRSYARRRGSTSSTFSSEGRRSAMRLAMRLARVPRLTIRCADYRDADVRDGDVVYCDPPYAGTEPYKWVGAWDEYAFWGVAAEWVRRGALVFVSEEDAPRNWVVAAETRRAASLQYNFWDHVPGKRKSVREERIYRHVSQATAVEAHRHAVEVRAGARPWPGIE